MTVRRCWQIALGLWFVVGWVLSVIHLNAPEVANGDKIGHFVFYGLLAWLAANLGWRKAQVWLVASLVGVSVECVQYFLPWRSFDCMDMLANSSGALLGVLFASTVPGNLLPKLEKWKKP